MSGEADWLAVGRVRSVDVARRQLRINNGPWLGGVLGTDDTVCLLLKSGKRHTVKIVDVHILATAVLVSLSAGVSRDLVSEMKGATVCVSADSARLSTLSFPPVQMVIGFEVGLVTGQHVGRVTAGYHTPAQDTLEIYTEADQTILVPITQETFSGIDWKKRKLLLRNIERYIDNYAN